MKTIRLHLIKLSVLTASMILFFSSCSNPFKVDISNTEEFDLKIQRYEQALFSSELTNSRLQKIQKEYPLFLGNKTLDSSQKEQLISYVSDPYLQNIFTETEKAFPSLEPHEQNLSQAFRHIQFYFPKFRYPLVFSYISGTQDKAYFEDHTIVISLDRYLGSGNEYYNLARIPKYQQLQMKADYMERDVLMAIAKKYIPEPSSDAPLLEHMIYKGKLLYFIKSMMPDIKDDILFAQSEYHFNWLNNKQKELWRYYIENELLFKSDYQSYRHFISEAPFTSALGEDSAPRTGIWLGYQIVRSYMVNNKISLEQLIKTHGDQEFLIASKFKA